ncbi:MAG: PDDEXK nuclease domain-containing protein [Chloroflexota bacterium]
MSFELTGDQQYKEWLLDIKSKIRNTQIKAAIKVNQELLMLYWNLGAEIVDKQATTQWGSGFIRQLSNDLQTEFPDMKGFSKRNLETARQWYLFYSKFNKTTSDELRPIAQQLVAQLDATASIQNGETWEEWITDKITRIPWGHNIVIMSKCKNLEEALYYVRNTIHYSWSRAILIHHIESKLYHREGKALNNFDATLPKPQSDLARQTLKDPYIFDFLRLTKDHDERDLEAGLVEHITKFLMELGAGFSFFGRQYHLEVDGQDFYIDLLFYHVKLHCYVVIELKETRFRPEYAGKLNFYLSVVDDQLGSEVEQPTIGILICRDKNQTIAEYALRDIQKPIGVSEHQLTQSLPDDLKSSLPSIEEIERELDELDESEM